MTLFWVQTVRLPKHGGTAGVHLLILRTWDSLVRQKFRNYKPVVQSAAMLDDNVKSGSANGATRREKECAITTCSRLFRHGDAEIRGWRGATSSTGKLLFTTATWSRRRSSVSRAQHTIFDQSACAIGSRLLSTAILLAYVSLHGLPKVRGNNHSEK